MKLSQLNIVYSSFLSFTSVVRGLADTPPLCSSSCSFLGEGWHLIPDFECSISISTELLTESSRWSKIICNQSERIVDKTSCKRGKVSYLDSSNTISFKEMVFSWIAQATLESLEFFLLFAKSITLAELCYNFGVDTYYREEYDSCIAWLR